MAEQPLRARFKQAYQDLALFPLLTPEQIRDFRVPYNTDTRLRLGQAVEMSRADGKIVFAGHRGCGKSTLLAEFARNMRDAGYFVARFSIADLVEMSDVNHVNVLYAIALSLLSAASKQAIGIPEQTQRTLLDWFTTVETESSSEDIAGEMGLGVDLKFLSAKLKNEATFRKEIKRTFERKVSELARKADEIAALIQQATNKEVLVVIDDLDKLDLPLVKDIYQDNINSLFLPKFRIVFTIPVSAIRDVNLRAILDTNAEEVRLMAVSKLFHHAESRDPKAQPSEVAMQPLLAVLNRRIPDDLIEPETARQIVLMSGGVIRELVRIARECCNECMFVLRGEPERRDIKINGEILKLAIKNLRNEFARSLGQNRFGILKQTYETLSPPDAEDPEFLGLLHALYVLEYENDDLWYDVHPIVVDLLRRKELIDDSPAGEPA